MEEKKYDVFISYSHEDRIVAEGVCGYLESNKIRCFIDYRDIPKGASWPSAIPPAIRNSGLMLAIFSNNFNASDQTDNEISIAANRKIPVLVFRITEDSFDGTKEYFLTKSNWIEAFPEPEKCFGELYHNICILLGIKSETNGLSASVSQSIDSKAAKEDEFVKKGLCILRDENEDRDMAAYYFRKSAKAGNPEGEYRMGWCYAIGMGVSQSWEDAIRWYSQAAEHGQTDAIERLAHIYRYGIATERNIMRALELYTKAAEAGNGYAMKALGKAYHTGELGVQDEERSKEYYEMAFDTLYEQAMGENDPEAQHTLGNSYLDGEGVKQNYTQAVKMYNRAIANNFPNAYNSLGLCYDSGLGVAKDFVKGFELQLKAAELGSPVAMRNLALKYLFGEGVEKDMSKYLEWIKRSAECGHCGAQASIGLDYYNGENREKDRVQAKRWFEKAIFGGDYRSLLYLGNMYENGDIKDQDGPQKAFQLYKQAAIQGNVTAYGILADCYYFGKGVEENDIEAARWYEKMTEVYEEMISKGESHFTEEAGAGTDSFCDFGNFKENFVLAFENLAWIYRNSKSVPHNAEAAIKWETISKKLKGEDIDVQGIDDIRQLEEAARKNNVEALDKLLNLLEENNDELKLTEWATYAIEHKVFVEEANRLKGIDHVDLVLRKAQVENHRIYVDYIKAYLDKGGLNNCYALYNAACEEYKKGNLTLTKENWELIRGDAQSVAGGESGSTFGAGYLRMRQNHFDILFPDYRPADVANGDFSNERNFNLFYVSHTSFQNDQMVTDTARDMWKLFRKDKSYSKVIELGKGEIVNAGDFGKALNSFIYAYNTLCDEFPSVHKEMIDDFRFEMLVPFCSAEQIQKYCMQSMKALISVRSLFADKWQEILSNLKDFNKMLDIAEEITGDNLQLVLIEYVEIQIEADAIFSFSEKTTSWYMDGNKKEIAEEFNKYIRRLDENGIEHNLSDFTVDNLPAGSYMEFDDDEEEDTYEDGESQNSVSESAEELCATGDDYYFGQNGKVKDYEKALRYFTQAALLGSAYAQYSLAYCYDKGQGVQVNETEAARWYAKAAEQGHASSQCNLGYMYENGRGVSQNFAEAVKWYRQAADQGDATSQCNLGNMYEGGRGVSKDLQKAIYWYQKAADQGYERAIEQLKRL